MIRVMHIFYSFDIGGLEHVVSSLINTMNNQTFSHSICVFSDKLGNLEKVGRADLKVFKVKRMFSNDPTLIFRLIGLLNRERPDIVRAYNWGSIEGVLAAKVCGVKTIIYSEHGFSMEEVVRQKMRRVLARRWILRFCDRVIVPALSLKKWLINVVGIAQDKIVYIPNGCDTDRFYPGRDTHVRNMLELKKTDFVVGTVGSLNKIKGQDVLIEAFAKTCTDNMKLLIVGDGPERQKLADVVFKAKIGGKVLFAGKVVDPAPFYRAMDIFVLPSLSENAPNSLLEAMATGLPIIATDVGDVRHILGQDTGGIIVKPNDADAIARAIGAYLKDERLGSEKGVYSRQRILDSFGMQGMVTAYELLYTDLRKG